MTERLDLPRRKDQAPKPGDRLWSVYSTQTALERAAVERRVLSEVSQWLKTALIGAEQDSKIWDIQQKIEVSSPSHARYVGLVLENLEEWGFVTIHDDGSFLVQRNVEVA